MFREFLVEYKDGLLASVQGFLVLHKLDGIEKEQVGLFLSFV